jgi:hypothetical protein
MHLSQYGFTPEPIVHVLQIVTDAAGHLGEGQIYRKQNGYQIVLFHLRDSQDFDAARSALLAAGAREDGQRGLSVFGYRGQMICIECPSDLGQLAVPRSKRR